METNPLILYVVSLHGEVLAVGLKLDQYFFPRTSKPIKP